MFFRLKSIITVPLVLVIRVGCQGVGYFQDAEIETGTVKKSVAPCQD
jgi:hypothetical protein